MATIKLCTDIPQSKKLAEFLPIESADMFYNEEPDETYSKDIVDTKYPVVIREGQKPYIEEYGIPCWSLTALFNVMPQIDEWIIQYGHKNDKLFQSEPKIFKIWEHSIIPSYKVTYDNGLSTYIYDNPVDACVEMIEKLHKINLL